MSQETIGQERSRLCALRGKYDESMDLQTNEMQEAQQRLEREKVRGEA